MFAFYSREGGYDLAAINSFNTSYYFTKVHRDSDGDPFPPQALAHGARPQVVQKDHR